MSVIEAIQKLRPGSEAVVYDNDYSTVIWHKIEGAPPSESEILQTIKDLQTEKATAKATAETKLAALGLTADDLKALGLGGN